MPSKRRGEYSGSQTGMGPVHLGNVHRKGKAARMSLARGLLLASAVAFMIVAPGSALARKVKRCGIRIEPNRTGKLVRDVACGYRCTTDRSVRCALVRDDFRCPIADSGCAPESIRLERNATLDLNGFSLRAAGHVTAIICSKGGRGRCTVKGPGTFNAGKTAPIVPNDKDVILKNLTIDNDYDGFVTSGWVRATNLVRRNCFGDIVAGKGVRAKNVTLGGGCDLWSRKNLFADGIYAIDSFGADGTVRAKNVTGANYITGKDIYLTRASVPELLMDSVASSFQVHAQRKLSLRDSVIGGIESGEKPNLTHSSCLRSREMGSAATWGVCAED